MSKPSAIPAVRGFRDILPEECSHWQTLESAGRDAAPAAAELRVWLAGYFDRVAARAVHIELNSPGDESCRPAYRERLRKFGLAHLEALCGDCHRRLERNPLRLLDCKVPGCRE